MRFPIMTTSVALSLALAASPAQGQMTRAFGLIAGANSTDFRAESLDSTFKAQISGLGGAFVRVPLAQAWAVRAEAFYSVKRVKEQDTGTEFRMNYIQVPVLAQLAVPTNDAKTVGFILGLGPSVAFNTSCKQSGNSCEGTSRDLSGTDVTIMGSLGIYAGPIVFDTRVDMGLVDLNKTDGGPDTKTRSFLITVSYLFPF